MQGLTLPPTTGFPAPAGFPVPQPDPSTFGLLQSEQTSPLGLYLPPPMQIQVPQSSINGATLLDRLGLSLGGGVTPEMDYEQAAAQTDRALARISEVNPELAQQLEAQRGGVPQEEQQGFWGSVLQTVMESPIGKALELISRPGRVIPEILVDSDESVWKNIGDALAGKSTATMGQFLEKNGVFAGDDIFSKVMKGVVGFGLDVAVDPFTYFTAGLGSVGRIGATRFASKIAAKAKLISEEAGLSLMDDIVTKVGRPALSVADDASEEVARAGAFEYLWNSITQSRASMAKTGKWSSLDEALAVVDPDFVGAPLGMALEGAQRQAYLNAVKAADEAHKFVGKFGLNRLGPKMADQLGIPKENMVELLKAMKTSGAMGTRQAYMEGKYAGALLGGWRFSVPGVRMITPALWGTQRVDFSIARRFFSGLSGQKRLLTAAERGTISPELAAKALELGTKGGWKAIKEGLPQVAQQFGGFGGRLGTAFATASWQIGGITRNLGSFALVRGGGLGTALSADARKMVRTVKSRLQDESLTMEAVNRTDNDLLADEDYLTYVQNAVGDTKRTKGKPLAKLSSVEFQRTLHELDRAAVEKSGDNLLTIEALEYFPTWEAQKMGAEKYYGQLESLALTRGDSPEALALLRKRKEEALRVEAALKETPEAAFATRMYRVAANNTADRYNELGGHVANLTTRTQAEPVIHPSNRADVETGHAVQHSKDYRLVNPDLEDAGDTPGFNLTHVEDGPDGRGYQFEEIDESRAVTEAADEGPPAGPKGGDDGPGPTPEGSPYPPGSAGALSKTTLTPDSTRAEYAAKYVDNVEEFDFLEAAVEEMGDRKLVEKLRKHLGAGEDVSDEELAMIGHARISELVHERQVIREAHPDLEIADHGVTQAEKEFGRELSHNPYAYEPKATTTAEAAPAAKPKLEHDVEFQIKNDQIQVQIADGSEGFVKAKLSPEGNIIVQSASVPTKLRKQGRAEAMYAKLAEEAEKRGGKLVSDGGESSMGGYRTPAAEKMWKGFEARGLPVHFDSEANEWIWTPTKGADEATPPAATFANETPDEVMNEIDDIMGKHFASPAGRDWIAGDSKLVKQLEDQGFHVTSAGVDKHKALKTFSVPIDTNVGTRVVFGADRLDDTDNALVGVVKEIDPNDGRLKFGNDPMDAKLKATETTAATDMPVAVRRGTDLILVEGNHRRFRAMQTGTEKIKYVEIDLDSKLGEQASIILKTPKKNAPGVDIKSIGYKVTEGNSGPPKYTRVAEPDGTPKKVYHGSPDPFDEFAEETQRDRALRGKGFYFAEDPSVSSKHYARGGQGANVRQVYLDIKNPFDSTKEANKDEMLAAAKRLRGEVKEGEPDFSPGASYVLDRTVQKLKREWIDDEAWNNLIDINQDMFDDITEGTGRKLQDLSDDEMLGWLVDSGEEVFGPMRLYIESSTDDSVRAVLSDEGGFEELIRMTIPKEDISKYSAEGATSDMNRIIDALEDHKYDTVSGSFIFDQTASAGIVSSILKEMGHDGVFHVGRQDGNVWVAFTKDQIHPVYGREGIPEATKNLPKGKYAWQDHFDYAIENDIPSQQMRGIDTSYERAADELDAARGEVTDVQTQELVSLRPGAEGRPVVDEGPGDVEDYLEEHVQPDRRNPGESIETGTDEDGPYVIRLDEDMIPRRYDAEDVFRSTAAPRDVQTEQAARGGLTEEAEAAAQDDFIVKLEQMANDKTGLMENDVVQEIPSYEVDPAVRAIAEGFNVPAERLDEIDQFASLEAMDPKWEKYRPIFEAENAEGPFQYPEGMTSEQFNDLFAEAHDAQIRSLDAWHDTNNKGDEMYDTWMEWKAENPAADVYQKEEWAELVFGDPMKGGWSKMPPSDYLGVMGPGALDAELTAMKEIIGTTLGVRNADQWRFRDVAGKAFMVKDSNTEAAFKEIIDGPPEAKPPTAGAKKQKKATVQLKRPLIINEDEAKMLEQGKRAVTGDSVFDVNAEADEFVAKAMAMFEEPWSEEINGILDSEKWDQLWKPKKPRKGKDGKVPAPKPDPAGDKLKADFQKLMKDMGLDPQGMTEQMARIALESQQEAAARLKTMFLEQRGYDGVIRIKNGKQRVTVFEKGMHTGDKAPIWELSDNAPVFMPDRGYYHRRMSGALVEILEGNARSIEGRAPRDWDAHFERDTGDMTFREAEAHVRAKLAKMGIEVPDDVPIFDRDVSRNLNAYVDGMANDMGNVFLGREARRMQSMGLGRSPFVGSYIGPKYEAVPSAAYMNTGKWLSKQSEKLWGLAQKAARHQTVVAKKGAKEAQRIERALFNLNERLYNAIDTEVQKTERLITREIEKGKVPEYGRLKKAEVDKALAAAKTPTEIRKIIAGRGITRQAAPSLREAIAQATKPENLKPMLTKQISNREQELVDAARKADWHTNTMTDVTEEWGRIMHNVQAKVAEPKVALFMEDPNLVGMAKVQIPGLEGMHLPATMADELNYAARGFKNLNEFQKTWRRFLSWWKEWATWAWPGFHIRNMMGGWFNNFLGGVEYKDYVEVFRMMKARREVDTGAERKWANTKLSREFKNKHGLGEYYFGMDPTYADLATLMTKNGINSANSRSFGEARIGAEMLDKEMSKPADSPWTLVDRVFGRRTMAGKPGRKIAGALRGTGEMTENMLRGAAFLQGLKQSRGDFMAAHGFTMMRHGDYGDLTDWEYGAIRDILPFYKWMRTNTPLQIHQLFESPGKLLAVGHAREAAFDAAGIDPEEQAKMPAWALQGLSFPTLGSSEDAIKMVSADLPMNDLYQGAGEFFSSMLPLARPAFESYVADKSLFTGRPIEGDPVQVGWMSGIPFMGRMLQGIGIGEVGEDGEYYIDDKLQNVLGTVPIFSRFRNWIYEEPDRAKLRGPALISAIAGVGFRSYGDTEFRNDELNFYYSQVVPTLEWLKGVGYQLPTTDDLEAMYGASNNVLAAAGIDPTTGL